MNSGQVIAGYIIMSIDNIRELTSYAIDSQMQFYFCDWQFDTYLLTELGESNAAKLLALAPNDNFTTPLREEN